MKIFKNLKIPKTLISEQKPPVDSTPSTPSSEYKPLSYKLEQFIDETLGDISTPVPTPTTSVHLEIKNDTIQNIIEQV